MITVQRETLAQAWGDGSQPRALHRLVSTFPDEFDPDLGLYQAMEQAGKLLLYTAREDDELIGFCTMMIGRHPNMKKIFYAQSSNVYVAPGYQKGLIGPGYVMLKMALEEVTRLHVSLVRVGFKAGQYDLSPILKRLGFQMDEISYTLTLQGAAWSKPLYLN